MKSIYSARKRARSRTSTDQFYGELDQQTIGSPPIGCSHIVIFFTIILILSYIAMWIIAHSTSWSYALNQQEIERTFQGLISGLEKKVTGQHSNTQGPTISITLREQDFQTVASQIESAVDSPVKKLSVHIDPEGLEMGGVFLNPLALPIKVTYYPLVESGKLVWALKQITIFKIPVTKRLGGQIDKAFQPVLRQASEPLQSMEIEQVDVAQGHMVITGKKR